MTIMILGHGRIRPEQRARAVVAASAMSEASEGEPGCLRYRFASDLRDPDVIWVFEEWEEQAALDAHFGTVHFAEFIGEMAGWLDGGLTVTRYEIASSGPL